MDLTKTFIKGINRSILFWENQAAVLRDSENLKIKFQKKIEALNQTKKGIK